MNIPNKLHASTLHDGEPVYEHVRFEEHGSDYPDSYYIIDLKPFDTDKPIIGQIDLTSNAGYVITELSSDIPTAWIGEIYSFMESLERKKT